MNSALIILFSFATLGVLIAGLIVMARGGKVSKKYSNKLMVARVAMQAFAIGAIMILLLLK